MREEDSSRVAGLERLLESGERFHGWDEDIHASWQLNRRSLALLGKLVRPGDRTLETGCGYSTVVFAMAGAIHTSVTPFEVEIDRIRAFCERADVSLERVEFKLGRSEELLPRMEIEPLDLVLIDGSHAFPVPFIDWFYACRRLRVGGALIIDDTHIKTGEILDRFLAVETERWCEIDRHPALVAYRKEAEPMIPPWDWPGQPFCAKPRRVKGVGPSRLQELRSALGLRTRARKLLVREDRG